MAANKKKLQSELEDAVVSNAMLHEELVTTARRTREIALKLLRSSNAILIKHSPREEN